MFKKENFIKKNIAVIFGGRSVEHDISIITGIQVLCALDKDKYNIIPIYISKDNHFYTGKQLFDINTFSMFNFEKKLSKINFSNYDQSISILKGRFQKLKSKIDFAFLALHGGLGEGGGVQGLLQTCNIPFSTCGVLGSSICMNKYLTKLICQSKNILTPDFVVIDEKEYKNQSDFLSEILKILSFPLIVKPNSLGSSIGVNFCQNKEQLINAISFAFMFDRKVIVEKAVENLRELNIAVLGNANHIEFSDIEEVTPKKDFLTYENKYLNQNNSKGMESLDRIIPAVIDNSIKDTIVEYSNIIFKTLELSGCVRIDFLMDSISNKVYLNEINTIPGSIANYLWKEKKYSFSQLLEKMLDYSLSELEELNSKVTRFSSSVLNNYKSNSAFKLKK